jgi:hypothetical protein
MRKIKMQQPVVILDKLAEVVSYKTIKSLLLFIILPESSVFL